MSKTKSLVGLAVLMTAMVVLATSAYAEFRATPQVKTVGPIKTFPGAIIFQTNQGGPSIECKSLNAEGTKVMQGEWQIQEKTQKQQTKFFYQDPAIHGPHELLKIDKWGVCTGPTGIPATIQCNLQVEMGGQNGSAASAENGTMSIYPPGCTITTGILLNTCTINLQPDGNKELQGVTLKALGAQEVEIAINSVATVTSAIQESKELCKTLGIKSGQREGHIITKGPFITQQQTLG